MERYVFCAHDGRVVHGDSDIALVNDYAAMFLGDTWKGPSDPTMRVSHALGLDHWFVRPAHLFDHLESIGAGSWVMRDGVPGRRAVSCENGEYRVGKWRRNVVTTDALFAGLMRGSSFSPSRYLRENLVSHREKYSEKSIALVDYYLSRSCDSGDENDYARGDHDAVLVCSSQEHDLAIAYDVKVGENRFSTVRHSRGCDCGFPVRHTDYTITPAWQNDSYVYEVSEAYFVGKGNRRGVMIYVQKHK